MKDRLLIPGSLSPRDQSLEQIAERISNIERPHPVRVGIDGIENSGKTTLANELAPHIESLGRHVIRATVDLFHAPRAVRYRQGRESAKGYYEDSFDYDSFNDRLLTPLGPNGDRRYRLASLDWATDEALNPPEEVAPDNSILIVDGIFLLRPELVDNWDYRIFVHTDFDKAMERALRRDGHSFGSADNIRTLYSRRYHPAQRAYLEQSQPHTKADVIVDNNDPSEPKLIFSSEEVSESKEVLQPNLKVQFVSRDLPVDGSGGTSAYRLSFLRYLQSVGCHIEYLLLDYRRSDPREAEEDLHRFDDIMTVKKIELPQDELAPVWSELPTEREKAYVRKQVQGSMPDLVIADHPWLADVFDEVPNSTVKAVLTHDVQHQKVKDFREAGVNPYKRNNGFEQPHWDEQLETDCLSKADVIIAIQKDDTATFQRMLPSSEVVTMPVAASLPETEQREQIPGRCLFVGGGAGHNVAGLTWFLDNIWPQIRNQHPEANLHVSGDVCNKVDQEKYSGEESKITFRGRVDNLGVEYNEAEVCVVPLEVGSGLKLKLIEAMSYGKAVVSTSVGVQGVEEVSDYGVAVTDDAEGFATEVVDLLNNPRKRKAFEGINKQFIEDNFLPDAVYGNFITRVKARAPRLQQ